MKYETYSLTINEVREISRYIQSKDSKREPICISFYIGSDQAQSAMLKMLEDYTDSRFIISAPNKEVLIDTLRSRLIDVTDLKDKGESIESICSHINGDLLLIKASDSLYKDLAIKYIAMTTQDRLKLVEVESMIKKEIVNANKSVSKSKDDIHKLLISIIRELVAIYKTNIDKNIDKKDDIQKQIKQYNKLASQMMQPSASAKMIMDYVAYRLRV